MTIKYFTTGNWSKIEAQEIVRETDKCVFIKNPYGHGGVSRELKYSAYRTYHDTWEKAHRHLMGKCEHSLDSAKWALERAEQRLVEVQEMKPPVDGQST